MVKQYEKKIPMEMWVLALVLGIAGCLLLVYTNTNLFTQTTGIQSYDLMAQQAPEIFGVAMVGTMLIFPILWFIVAILIAVWVYKDAEKHGSSGPLWLIIIIFTSIIGLIIWLIVRKSHKKK